MFARVQEELRVYNCVSGRGDKSALSVGSVRREGVQWGGSPGVSGVSGEGPGVGSVGREGVRVYIIAYRGAAQYYPMPAKAYVRDWYACG